MQTGIVLTVFGAIATVAIVGAIVCKIIADDRKKQMKQVNH